MGDTRTGHTPSGATLEAADRLAKLGTLVASAAHEINNPITYVLANLTELETLCGAMRESVLGYRAALKDALGDRAESRVLDLEAKVEAAGGLELIDELLGDAFEGAERIHGVVRDLLSVARPACGTREAGACTAGGYEAVDVHEVLDATLRVVHRDLAQSAELKRDYRATHPALGDRGKLGQAFLNLISNAIHACEHGSGVIVVRTRDVDANVEIEVEDSGTGVRPELEPDLFKPFFTTKGDGRGTGLGLFISRQIVVQHGGMLDFRGREGGGTIFRVSLPWAASESDETKFPVTPRSGHAPPVGRGR